MCLLVRERRAYARGVLSLAAAEMYSCAIRGKENIEWVEVSEEETIDLDELEDMFPDDFCGV